MNALYDAPVDEHGNPMFAEVDLQGAPRASSRRGRCRSATPRRRTASRSRCAIASAASTRPRSSATSTSACTRRQQIDRKTYGAGLGLYLIANAATQFVLNVAPGMATEVVCTFDRKGAHGLLRTVLERVHHADPRPAAPCSSSPLDVVPQGLAILDAPDIDSVEESNRHLAAQLLAAADLWLFVTSAARYADQVPWDFLRQAAERSAAVAIVLDRTPQDAVETVASHLARMLAARGLKDSPLFTVNEVPARRPGPAAARGRWPRSGAGSTELGADAERPGRDGAADARGRVRSLTRRAHTVADACLEQAAAAERLRDDRRRGVRRGAPQAPRGHRRRHPPARRGAGALAGVRRHRRAAEVARGQGRPAPRPDGQRDQGQAASRPSASPSRSSRASRR